MKRMNIWSGIIRTLRKLNILENNQSNYCSSSKTKRLLGIIEMSFIHVTTHQLEQCHLSGFSLKLMVLRKTKKLYIYLKCAIYNHKTVIQVNLGLFFWGGFSYLWTVACSNPSWKKVSNEWDVACRLSKITVVAVFFIASLVLSCDKEILALMCSETRLTTVQPSVSRASPNVLPRYQVTKTVWNITYILEQSPWYLPSWKKGIVHCPFFVILTIRVWVCNFCQWKYTAIKASKTILISMINKTFKFV